MFADIKAVLGEDRKKLYKPMILLVIDTIFNMVFYGALYGVLLQLIQKTLTLESIKLYSVILVVAFILRTVLNTKGYTLMQCRGSRIIEKSRIKLGDHVRNLNLGYFNKNSIGKLTNIMTLDLQELEQIMTHSTSDLIKTIFLSLYLLSITFIIDVQLAFIQLMAVAIAFPIIIIGGKRVARIGADKKEIMNYMISRMVEYLTGIQVFKSHNLVGDKFKRLKDSFGEFRKECIRTEVAIVPFVLIFQIIVDLSFPVLLLIATLKFGRGDITKETLLTFMIVNISLINILRGFGAQYGAFRYLRLAVTRLKETYSHQAMSYKEELGVFDSFDIAFEQVQFEYEPNEPILNKLSFVARENEMTALIGPSGSGKTTVTSLIARFWDVTGGCIKIGGKDISTVSPDGLMAYVSMVFQDVYLLHDTVYNNIALGNPSATKEKIIEAAKISRCHDFIEEMDMGYETIVGEGGSTLSGGEKQRISIARALLKDAPIVLLDEATASLDADNELEIRHSINELTKRKTVIVIAHRLNTIKDADQIIVLNNGSVEESGTHETLLNNKKRYYNMYNEMERAKDWQMT